MVGALRVISVERGFDPAEFALVAFGGAGGLHAVQLAVTLGVSRVIIPPDPGLLSAFGILTAPIRREETRTLFISTDHDDLDAQVARAREDLDSIARERLQAEAPGSEIRTEHRIDARYRGQSYELRVPADGWLEHFHSGHQTRYGYARRESAVELITVRVAAIVEGLDAETAPPSPNTTGDSEPAQIWFDGSLRQASRVWRHQLPVGTLMSGPVLILEYSSTTWVPGGWRVAVEASGSLGIFRDV